MAYLKSGAALTRTRKLDIRGDLATGGKLLLTTTEPTVVDGNELGRIDFQAPLDTAGTDAILVAASIYAEADNTFSSSVNATELVFAVGKSGTAAEVVRIDQDGKLGIGTTAPAVALEVIDTGNQETVAGFGADDDGTAFISVRTAETQNNLAGLSFDVGSASPTGVASASTIAEVVGKVMNSGGTLQGELQFHTNDGDSITQKMVITEAGSVGIGVAAPASLLHVAGTMQVGVDDTGYDVKFFGDTASRYWLWDTDADGVVQRGTLTVGVDDTGHDVQLFGATAGAYMLWDESADNLYTVGGAGIYESAGVLKENLLPNSGWDSWSQGGSTAVGSDIKDSILSVIGTWATSTQSGGEVQSGIGSAPGGSPNPEFRGNIVTKIGHMYKLTTTVTQNSGVGIRLYINNVMFASGSGTTTYNQYWVATSTATNWQMLTISTNATNFSTASTSVYEVVPACVDANTNGVDGWFKASSADIYREQWDNVAGNKGGSYNVYHGNKYSLKNYSSFD